MKKTLLTLSLIIVLSLVVGGCGKKQQTETNKQQNTKPNVSQNKETKKLTKTTTSQDCGEDMTCANKLVTGCQPGKFLVKYNNMDNYHTIKGTKDGKCEIIVANKLSDFGPFGKPNYDVDKDGLVSADCLIPQNELTDVNSISKILKNNLNKYCQGEMVNLLKDMENAFNNVEVQ